MKAKEKRELWERIWHGLTSQPLGATNGVVHLAAKLCAREIDRERRRVKRQRGMRP